MSIQRKWWQYLLDDLFIYRFTSSLGLSIHKSHTLLGTGISSRCMHRKNNKFYCCNCSMPVVHEAIHSPDYNLPTQSKPSLYTRFALQLFASMSLIFFWLPHFHPTSSRRIHQRSHCQVHAPWRQVQEQRACSITPTAKHHALLLTHAIIGYHCDLFCVIGSAS